MNAGSISFIKFIGCVFTINATDSDTNVGVYLNENDAAGGKIDAVEFVGCSFDGFPGPGLWITSQLSRIQVTGGIFENNNKNTSSSLPMGQISIIGGTYAPIGVNVSGASIASSNQYAMAIESGASNVLVSNCNFGTTPTIYFNGPGAQVRVIGCAGYNDQQTPINSNDPPTSSSNQSAADNGYYGPSLVTCENHAAGSITVTVNSKAFTVPASGFFSIF